MDWETLEQDDRIQNEDSKPTTKHRQQDVHDYLSYLLLLPKYPK